MRLPRSFFARSTPAVARDLLGKTLTRQLPDGTQCSAIITETEAYDGFHDRASHAHRAKTKRNAVMFGPPGVIYLYLCYGIHWMLNVSAREVGYPAAVLVRGTTRISGPGRLTRYFALNGKQNGLPLGTTSGLWISDSKTVRVQPASVCATPRIGVEYAGPRWSAKNWRFVWNKE